MRDPILRLGTIHCGRDYKFRPALGEERIAPHGKKEQNLVCGFPANRPLPDRLTHYSTGRGVKLWLIFQPSSARAGQCGR